MATFSQQTISDFLQRNLTLIIVSGSIVAFWLLIYAFAIYKPSYAAKSVVIIKDSAITRRYIEPEQYYALQTTTSNSSNPVLNTMGILKSGAISDAVYHYFQTHHPEQLKKHKIKDVNDWESFFGDGSGFIKAKNQSGTDLISIQFTWSNPVISKEVLQVVVKAFQEASRDLNKEELVNRTRFLGKQAREIEAQLDTIREQKSSYQRNTGTVSLKKEGDELATGRLELNNKLNQTEAWAQGKEEQLRRYERTLGMTPEQALKSTAIGQNETIWHLQSELYRLRQLYSQTLAANPGIDPYDAPEIQEIRAQIIQVQANIQAEKTRTVGKTKDSSLQAVNDTAHSKVVSDMVSTQTEAQELHAQADVLRARLRQMDAQIQKFPEVAEGLTNIEQKESSLSLALDQLRQKVMEGRIKEDQTASNVFIVDAPRMPEREEFPTRSHLILLSFVLGTMAGLSVAFAKEQLFPDTELESHSWLDAIEDDEPDLADELAARQKILTASNPLESRVSFVEGSLFNSLIPVSGPLHPEVLEAQKGAGKQNPYVTPPTGMHNPIMATNVSATNVSTAAGLEPSETNQ